MALPVGSAGVNTPRRTMELVKDFLLIECVIGTASSFEKDSDVKRDGAAENTLRDLLNAQRFAVLATHDGDRPHGSVVAFVVADDLRDVVFATTRATRKFANLSKDARVALVVDNLTNQETDIQQAMAVTVSGNAAELGPDERARWMARYVQRHPCLQDFVQSPSCALVRIRVEKYDLVERFQNVVEIRFEP